MGIAEMPSIICRRELREGLLVPVMAAWRFEEVDLSAYSLSRRHPPRIVELFLAHCSANAENCLVLSSSPVPNVLESSKNERAPLRRRTYQTPRRP